MSLTKEITVRYALILAFTACVALLYLLAQMAADYAVLGHGLHPALAMLGGVVTTILGGVCLHAAAQR